ncbi:MAG: hypothetical protein ACI9O4_001608 [Chitinophagales bacterium]|jgi:uncharacterized protein YbaP (TraB family)
MKKILLSCLSLLFLFISYGQNEENALLWEISKKRVKTSYLYGTIHSQDQRVIHLAKGALPFLYQCDAYAGEIMLDPNDAFAAFPFLIEKNKTKRCKSVFDKDQYEQIEELVKESLGKEMLLVLPFMSPYMTALMLSIPPSMTENSEAFLDVYFQGKADSMGHELISLETLASQFAYIQKIEISAQKNYLLEFLEEKEDIDSSFEEILLMYLAEDLAAISQELINARQEDPLFTDEFMKSRNQIHFQGMIAAMKKQKTFTAVGAAHLPGELGILNLLRQEGYRITPVSLK